MEKFYEKEMEAMKYSPTPMKYSPTPKGLTISLHVRIQKSHIRHPIAPPSRQSNAIFIT
jgi:hypothetical protein